MDTIQVIKDRFAIAFFKTQDLEDVDSNGEFELKLTGKLQDGTTFEGTDTIRVINKGRFSALSSLLANLREALSRLLGLLKSR